ncbi:MAG: peptidoglycan DD-metalloendopeptidase family protein [Patescibacteria group bacterium]|nr:peptidoglycan DD-metalloendopeptidase family protein [Patescibacteria group bacterium]
MKRIHSKYYKCLILIIAAVLIFVDFNQAFAQNGVVSISSEEGSSPNKDEIEALNEQVKEKQDLVDNLSQQMEIYKQKIVSKQSEISSLQEQMEMVENRIAKAELDIQIVKTELEGINLELSLLEKQIAEKEELISKQKESLTKLIQRINKLDQRTYLEVLLANDSFSEFFDQIKYLEDIQADLQTSVEEIKGLKTDLETKRSLRETKKTQLEASKIQLELNQESLFEEFNLKNILIEDTQSSESMYRELLNNIRQEKQYIDNQVSSLEDTLREKIEAMDKAFSGGADTLLSWPVSPARGITAYFHDPTYPFRYLFEHSGIDLRVYQGTPVAAAAPGYVVWAKQGKMYGNFVMILHANGISTVYGHFSKISVKVDEFVERGDIIGLSGGMPGTPGAGLSTGPHLHFEVRKNGIPTNPLDYLINQ